MAYVFDTSSLREASHMSPSVFKTFWKQFNQLVASGEVVSVREVFKELEIQSTKEHLDTWRKSNSRIFRVPSLEEMLFVRDLFAVERFQQMVRKKQRLRGSPVADPFVIAAAKIGDGCVVSEEKGKAGSVTIPNVCQHYRIDCTDLEGFLKREGWSY